MAIDFIEDAPAGGIDFVPDTEATSPEKLSLQSEMQKLREERDRGDWMESLAGGAESIVERLTPAGLLNQPLRAIGLSDVFHAGVGTDLPEPGPNFEAMMRMAGRAEGPLISGVGKLLSRTAEGLTTPESIVTLPAAAVSLPVRAMFAGQMAQHLPEQIGQAGEVLRSDAPLSEKIAAGGAPLVTAAMLREVGRTPDWLPEQVRPELTHFRDLPVPPPPTPIRELGIRVPEGPFAQPGIAELADAALREKMSLVKDPRAMGATLNDLRAAMGAGPEIVPETIATLNRPRAGGETLVRPKFEGLAVEPGFERTASDMLLERQRPEIQNATQAEVAKVLEEATEKPTTASSPEVGMALAMEHPIAAAFRDTTGKVYQSTSHPQAVRLVPEELAESAEMGFVTDRGNFVNYDKGLNLGEARYNALSELGIDPNKVEAQKPTASAEIAQVAEAPTTAYEKLLEARREYFKATQEWIDPNDKLARKKVEDAYKKFKASQTEEAQSQRQAANEPTKGIITGRAIEKWADDTLKGGATHLGPDVLAAYMVKGAALIERGIINFAEWSAKMIAEHGPSIKPHLRDLFAAAQATVKRESISESGTLKSSREIVEQRIRQMTEGEEVKMRKSAARATESPAIPEPVQERIATSPESFYKVQPNELVEQAVKRMSDTELVSVPADSNLFVASRLEAANRLFNAGKMDEGYRVFEELEKQGTSFGQNINQFKRLPGTLPEHTAFVINQKLKKAGKDVLTERQEAEVITRTKASKKADSDLDVATDAWRKNPTDENAVKAQEALIKANNAAIELQRFLSRFEPKSFWQLMKSIMQGTLLTPISLGANIAGNINFNPMRAGTRGIGAGFDVLDNYLTGRPRELTVSPARGTEAYIKGAVEGAKKIPSIAWRGTGDTFKGEARTGLHPVEAWMNQFSKNPDVPTTGGKLTLGDRAKLAIEGTLGIPAEVMLRGLGVGDVMFKEGAHHRVIANQLKLQGVPKSQWPMAYKFPELFFDRATMEQIGGETAQAVFQRESRTVGFLTKWLKGKGDFADFLGATVAPYKLTPWNVIAETLSYNPVVALFRGVYDASKGNTRAAKLNAGKFFVGLTLTAAGTWLYRNGLVAPSLDDRTEAQKARILSGEVLPPNHLNVSGLKRKLQGGDPAFQKGDETRDIMRAGGLAGSIIYMTANIGRHFEKEPEAGSYEHMMALLQQSTLEQGRFGLNQSFLSGVEGFLTALKDGNTDHYMRQWMKTVLSIPFPNTLDALSRATRKYQVEVKDDSFVKDVSNTIRSKLGFAGLDDYLPLKRGLWGEPLPQTPKGANALFYHFFDVTKGRQVTDDPVPIELYRLWRSTADTRAIPSLPENTVTSEGTTYVLTPEQRSRYAELIGKNRRQIVDAMVINPEYHKKNDEGRIDALDSAYSIGMKIGKKQFLDENKSSLTPKGARAGFQPKP